MRAKIVLLLYLIVALVAQTDPANAGPIAAAIGAIASAVSGAIAAGGIVGALIKAAISIAINIGIGLLTRAKKETPVPPGITGQMQVGGDNPVSFIMGHYATAGQLEYVNTYGQETIDGNDINNNWLVMVISLSDLPVTMLHDRLWVNGEECTIKDVPESGDRGFGVEEYVDDGRDFLVIKFHDGTQTVADNFLMTAFGSDPDRPWQSDMIGRGVPYAIVQARINRELFTGVPQCRFEINGIKLYDRRKDSTNGGSGTHRWSNPATWEFSSNPVVMIENILRGIWYNGTWLYGLQEMYEARLPTSSWFAAANACDAMVAVAGGGTEPQFRAGIEVLCDSQPFDVIDELLKACNGRMAEIGGVYKIHVGAPPLAVYAFDDGSIVLKDGQSFDPFPGLESTFNGIHATYPEPLEAWESKDAPPRYNASYEVDDSDRRLIADVVFPAVPYATQVQRLTRPIIEEERRFRKHVITLPPEAWLLEPNDVVSWTSARNGYIDKKFFVVAIDGQPSLNQTVSLKEVDPTDYDWDANVHQKPYSLGFLGTIRPAPQPIIDWFVEPYTLVSENGRLRPAIKLNWMPVTKDGIDLVKFEVRKAVDDEIVVRGNTAEVAAGSLIITQSLIANTNYEARGQYFSYDGRRVVWSGWLPVTTPDTKLSADDILANAIRELHLADRAISNLKIKLLALTSDLIANDAIIERTIAALAVTEAKVAANAISVNKIVNGAIVNGKLADNAVTTAKIIDNAIQAAKIFDGAVNTGKLANDAVTNLKLAPLAVEAGNIANNAITSTKITDGAILTPKLAANAVVADKIAANAIVASKLIIGDYSNMYPDYDLLDPDFYSVSGGGSFSFVDTSHPLLGQRYISLSNRAGINDFVVTDWMAIEEQVEHVVKVKAWVVTGGVGAVYAQVGELDTAGAIIDIVSLGIDTNLVNTGVTEYTRILTAAELAGKKRIRFVFYNLGVSGSTAATRYGGPVIRRKVTSEIIVDGAITADKISANAVSADKIAAGAITTKHMVITDFTNLMGDPFFALPDQWQSKPNPPFSFGTAASAGYNAADTYLNVFDGVGSLYQWGYQVACLPGDAFRLVGIGKRVNATAGQMRIVLQFRDADNTSLGSTVQTWTTADSTAYAGKVCEGVAPANTTTVVVIIDTAGTTVVNGFRMGFIGLYRRATSTLIVDGAITADKISANQITGVHIVGSTITGAHVATGTLTASDIAANAITASELAAGAVVAVNIASNVITASHIAAGAITASELATGSVTAIKIVSGSITALQITSASAVFTESIQIGNTIIDTNHMIGGAISTVASVYTAAEVDVPHSQADLTVATLSISNPTGAPIVILASVKYDSPENGTLQLRLFRSTTMLRQDEYAGNGWGYSGLEFRDASPGAGTINYNIKVDLDRHNTSVTPTAYVSRRFLCAMVLKK